MTTEKKKFNWVAFAIEVFKLVIVFATGTQVNL